MKTIPILFVAIAMLVMGTGCAKKDIKQMGERMMSLERDVLETRTDTAASKDEVRDLELRVDYLEREAVARGVKVPPRVPAASPVPASAPSSGTGQPNALPASPMPATPDSTQASAGKSAPTLGRGASFALAPAGNTAKSAPKADPAASKKTKSAPATSSKTAGLPSAPSTPVDQANTQPGTLPEAQGETASLATTSVPTGTAATTGTMPLVSESTPRPATPSSSPSAAPVPSEKNAYNTALQFYRTGRFAEAEAAFQAFLEVYPNSGLVPNALYWKGETFYSRSRFPDAIFAFKDVQTRFPKHPKNPDSLLKTAMAYGKMGDKANESLHLTVLIEDWPQAEATKRAQKMGLKP